jgi:rhodanese-related sulfurtransferase
MKAIYLLALLIPGSGVLKSQFKNDNMLYKTIDPFELCNALQQSPGYILLDVRSKGEYEDTSSYNLNYGRFKNAININIRELGQRIHELDAYKNKPVFVYCSHSQRSRRAGKMLADSGFTNINNVNGGITSFHYLSVLNQPCARDIYETKNSFHFISPAELCKKLSSSAATIFLLDVRSDSSFKHISRDDKENALGYLTGSVNIPLATLLNSLSAIPASKEIIITDIYGQDAGAAAKQLMEKGYKNVTVLIEGIDRWMSMNETTVSCKNSLYKPAVSYNLISTSNFGEWVGEKKIFTLVDIRTTDEFTNQHKEKYRNTGRIKNAINIPATEMETRWSELNQYKNEPIVLYGFGGGTEAFTAAGILVKKGFTKVNVLFDGIFNIRWTAGNVTGWSWLSSLVENIPEENQ